MFLRLDFREKRPGWRFRCVVSDAESERSRKILQPENDCRQGRGNDAPFSRIVRWIDDLPNFRTSGRPSSLGAKSVQILGKLLSARTLLNFGGPAGGQCTLTGAWPPTARRKNQTNALYYCNV